MGNCTLGLSVALELAEFNGIMKVRGTVSVSARFKESIAITMFCALLKVKQGSATDKASRAKEWIVIKS